jgi:thiamine biosynthesis lipoprotein
VTCATETCATETCATGTAQLTARSLRAIGTTATVVVQDPAAAEEAAQLLSAELEAIDAACSRFRADSELQRLHARAGRPVEVSGLLFAALTVAVDAAERTGGAVDPTVGNALVALGYDDDIAVVRARSVPPRALGTVAGYAHVQLDPTRRTVCIPRGVRLDLGATTKALAADRAAARITAVVGSGALVSLGGDVAVCGEAPAGGWPIGIARESSASGADVEQVVAISRGGLASSATAVRSWRSGGRDVHHIVDPRTGDCADPYWILVSATGISCVEANLATTAAVVWGADALHRLMRFEQSLRLVRADGQVFSVNGWPLEAAR